MAAGRPAELERLDRECRDLMVLAQAGDQAAYARLLRACVPVIKATARSTGVTLESLDDVVQETLLTLHRARHTYDSSRSFTAWMRTLAQRRAIDFLRRQRRSGAREVHSPHAYETFADQASDPATTLESNDHNGVLACAVAALPARQREAVEHLVLRERSLAEAAAATGRKTGSLKVSLHRAVKSLRAGLLARD